MADQDQRTFSTREAKAERATSRLQRATNPQPRSFEGDLGAGTPPNVDVHKLGQEDRPQEDWGEPAAEGATFSANHSRRAVRTEAERSQGSKTRTANKNIVSRRR